MHTLVADALGAFRAPGRAAGADHPGPCPPRRCSMHRSRCPPRWGQSSMHLSRRRGHGTALSNTESAAGAGCTGSTGASPAAPVACTPTPRSPSRTRRILVGRRTRSRTSSPPRRAGDDAPSSLDMTVRATASRGPPLPHRRGPRLPVRPRAPRAGPGRRRAATAARAHQRPLRPRRARRTARCAPRRLQDGALGTLVVVCSPLYCTRRRSRRSVSWSRTGPT